MGKYTDKEMQLGGECLEAGFKRAMAAMDAFVKEADSTASDSFTPEPDPDGKDVRDNIGFTAFGFIVVGVMTLYQFSHSLTHAARGVEIATEEGLSMWADIEAQRKEKG